MRNLSLFAICGIPMLAYTFRDFTPKSNTKTKIRPKLQKILLLLFCVAIIATFSIRLYQTKFYKDSYVPVSAVEYILDNYNNKEIHLFVGYNWGGYAEFRGLKPFIDARAEVYIKKNNKKADILHDLIALNEGTMHYAKFIQKYRLNVFLLERKDLLETYLAKDPQYTLVYRDKEAVVFEKKSE